MTRKITYVLAVFGLMASTSLSTAADRIVSIGGSVTETIYALGGEAELVGADTTSYFPAAANKLPKVGYQRTLSAEGVLSLAPTKLIGSDEAGPATTLEQLKAAGVSITLLKAPRDVAGINENIRQLGQILDRDTEAQQLTSDINSSLNKLKRKIATAPVSQKVLFVMTHGAKTPMSAGKGTSADAILKLAGVQNASPGFEGYKPLTAESLAVMAPDVILTTHRTLQQVGGIEQFLALPGFNLTPAAQNKRVIAMDSLRLLGFGPRTVEAANDLYEKLKSL
ncbi:MAG: ABC transporter substrate-binding protein [Sneathiella sp.]|nr:ABC transporter substrate-binding protein [Sneathiella sp.]